MHRDKEAQRGYNQSRLLADSISKETGFPVEELLCRPVAGQMQAGLDKSRRRKALDHVFQWSGSVKQDPGPAVIVDDVVTTGATLESCARILKQHGFQPIWGLTFAGGSGEKARNP
jgi:predicted amidophosphoribosyltransferase